MTDVVNLADDDIEGTIQSGMGSPHYRTGYSLTYEEFQKRYHNTESGTISTSQASLDEGEVVELTEIGPSDIHQGTNHRVIRLTNPQSLHSLAQNSEQVEELEEGAIVDSNATARQAPQVGTSYSLLPNQLCESCFEPEPHLGGKTTFQPRKPYVTKDCQVTYGPLLGSLGLNFSFYFSDLACSMDIAVLRNSKEYIKDPVSVSLHPKRFFIS